MKAVRFYGPLDLRVEEVAEPQPDDESVIIKVRRASICNGSDTALFSGRRERRIAYPWMELPWIMGHECAGEVVAVGSKVSGFQIGDRVASLKYGNAFAELQKTTPAELIRLPAGMPYDQGTYMEPLWVTLSYRANVRPGDRVVVCGVGPSGLLLLQEAQGLGAARVCACLLYTSPSPRD